MKYVFVGDVHGKVEAVERALKMDGMKVFVGDFMDSYDRKPADHGQCLRLVCDAIRRGEAQAIFGNHELSYLMPRQHRCSGHSAEHRILMHAYSAEVRELFKPHLWLEESLLVTHAGLTLQMWQEHGLTLETLDAKLNEWWLDVESPVHYIGSARGGGRPYGGTFWCDFNREFRPVPGLSQVFGHTRGNGIRVIDQSYCIDCLDSDSKFLTMELEESVPAMYFLDKTVLDLPTGR